MPLLTDRQEPEDFSTGPEPEDPNDYALRYLFKPNRPGIEYHRTGQTLFYSGAATNLLALALYFTWLEFNFLTWQIGLALLVVLLSAAASYLLSKRHFLAPLAGCTPAGLLFLSLLYTLLAPSTAERAVYLLFFLPGSLAMLVGVVVLRAARRQA